MSVDLERRTLARRVLPFPELAALSLRDYRLWWISSSASTLNQFGMQIVLAWWVQKELQSPALVGTILLAFGLPSFIFILPAGMIADRWDRKAQLMVSQVIALIAAMVLGVLLTLDKATFLMGVTVAFISGTTVAFGQPARQSLIPMMVPRRLLANGIVLGSLSMNASRMIAPAVAGWLMATIGVNAGLFFISLFLLGGIYSLARMKMPHFAEDDQPAAASTLSRQRRENPCAALAAGFDFLWQNRPLFVLMALYMATGVFIVGPLQALVPVLVDQEWGLDARGVGYAFSVQALTGLIMGLYLTKMGGLRNKGGFFALSMVGGGGSVALYSISPAFGLALVFFGTFGVAASMYANMSQSILQSMTPRILMGRVMSIYQLSVQGLLPLGAFFAGLLAETLGAPLTGLIGGSIGVALAVIALVFARDFRRLS